MGIFSDAQGQLTPQLRKSGNTVFSIITLSVAMDTSSQIWPNFKLIQAVMYVIITCKYDMDLIKIAEKKWQHRISHHKPVGIFSEAQGQLTLRSVIGSG